MKTAFFLIISGLVVIWFANDSIQSYRLMTFENGKWTGTDFQGWGILSGAWVLLVAVSLAVAAFVTAFVALLSFDFEQREKELNAKHDADKQATICDIFSNVDSRAEEASIARREATGLAHRLETLEKRHSAEIKRMDSVIKSKQEQIRRMRRRIDKLKLLEH